MQNPNPLYYRDLVTPDSSITDLIAQLTGAIEKYEELQSKVKQSASEAAKAMSGMSGATQEQRAIIFQTAEEANKLAEEMKKLRTEEGAAVKEVDRLKQAQKEYNKIAELQEKINKSAEGSYNRLSAQYRLNKIRINEMSAAERERNKYFIEDTRRMYEEMSRLQKETGKYTLEVGHYENALRALPGPLGMVAGRISQMGQSFRQMGQSDLPLGAKALNGFSIVATGVIGIVSALAAGFQNMKKRMVEFEQANANLATILGVTKEEMKGLTDSAKQLGRSTEFTASQVTQLQTELAKLGFGQGSIMAMQKSVLNFATAVGAGLGEAAEVAGSTLRAFNLTSADTEDVLGTLAVATNRSALNFEKIRNSIGTVFPVANAFGISVKDTVALLGSLANAGFDASSAATATRNILLNLADANGKLAKSIGGPVRDFDGIINALQELRDRGIDVGEALELTDRRSVSAFSAFLSGADSVRELRDALEDVDGELERIAKERLDTAQGSALTLQSAWEGLILSFGSSVETIKETNNWLARLVRNLNAALFPTQAFTEGMVQNYTAMLETAGEQVDDFIGIMRGKFEDEGKELSERGFFGRLFGKGDEEALNKRAQAFEKAVKQREDALANAEAERIRQEQNRIKSEQEEQDKLTKEEIKAREKARKEAERAAKAAAQQRLKDRQSVIDSINFEISATEAGTQKMLDLRLDRVEAQRQLELEKNRQAATTARKEEAVINAKFDADRIREIRAFNAEVSKVRTAALQRDIQAAQLQLAVTEKGTEAELGLRLSIIEKQMQIELTENRAKVEKEQQDEMAIRGKYMKLAETTELEYRARVAREALDISAELAKSQFELMEANEREKTEFQLRQERARLAGLLEINKTAAKKLTAEQVRAIEAQIEAVDQKLGSLGYSNIYEVLGISISKEKQGALNTAYQSIRDNLTSVAESWLQVAQAAREAADAQVESAQNALNAEIEARNAGYANSVETARKELALAQSNRQKALADEEQAKRAQVSLDTIEQTSSLVTASANLWKTFSKLPGGPVLALTAIAGMWTSFAAAKVKAAELTKTEKYGEGTVELLQGGSHASGHDISLGRKADGTERRAEGGEFFAVINKRNSRRFRGVIPEVIKAFNDGTFSEKYQRAGEGIGRYAITAGTDVSRLEGDVRAIRMQGERTESQGDGYTIMRYKNLTRKIKS